MHSVGKAWNVLTSIFVVHVITTEIERASDGIAYRHRIK